MYLGDIRLGDSLDFKFTTRQVSGAPFTLAGSPVLSAYVGNSTTEITAGITLSVDFDSRTGLNQVRVVASSGNGFATATNVDIVITTGTVNSVSVVGEVVGSFSIENRSALMPTTATRTLDVSATGEADANVTQYGGSNGTFAGGRPEVNTSHAGGTSWTAGAIINATFANETGLRNVRNATAQAGGATTITLDASASAVTDFYINDLISLVGVGTGTGQSRFITAYDGTTKVATVDSSWAVNPDNTSVFVIRGWSAVPGATAPTAAQVATAVWQDLTAGSDFTTANSVGKLIVDNLNATISSRMATYTQPTGFLAATFPGGTIANTTNITGGTITTATNVTNVNGLAADVITATSINTGAITAAKFAADAIDSSALAASAVNEIQSGLSTSAVTNAIKAITDQFVFTVPNQVDANALTGGGGLDAAGIRAAIGMASADLDTQLEAINTNINGVQQATIIKNSTGNIEFPMVLTIDHFTAATGMTVTGQRSFDGATFVGVSGTITEVGLGVYNFEYDAADSNADTGSWIFSAATCDDTLVPFITSE